jgi:hypothetical protein
VKKKKLSEKDKAIYVSFVGPCTPTALPQSVQVSAVWLQG